MNRPYEQVRILDLTHDLGRYVGRLFADLGAEVIKVEPPGGAIDRVMARNAESPEFAAEFEFFNASKKSLALDFKSAAGRSQFLQLCATSQVILLEAGGPWADACEELQERAPGAVITVISPFGSQGPYRDLRGGDLILQAAGGLAWLSGRLGDAPLRLPGNQSTMITGVYAAVSTALALVSAEAIGHGHFLDVSAQEAIAHSLQNSIQVWDFESRVSMRGGEGTRDASEAIFACKDGTIALAAPRTLGVSWNALVAWIGETGHPSFTALQDERWANRTWRQTRDAREQLKDLLEPFTRQFTRDELVDQALVRKIVLGPVNSLNDLLSDPQLEDREYFIKLRFDGAATSAVFPGAPYKLSEAVWRVEPAPTLAALSPAAAAAAAAAPTLNYPSECEL